MRHGPLVVLWANEANDNLIGVHGAKKSSQECPNKTNQTKPSKLKKKSPLHELRLNDRFEYNNVEFEN